MEQLPARIKDVFKVVDTNSLKGNLLPYVQLMVEIQLEKKRT